MNREAQEGERSVAPPESAFTTNRPHACFVRICVDVVFHFDVLKPTSPEGEASGGRPGDKTKNQMSLDLDDLW